MNVAREHLAWSLTTHDLAPDPTLPGRLRRKITPLEAHLRDVPIEDVHLNVALEQTVHGRGYTATMSLQLPDTVLHVAKSHTEILSAVVDAIGALRLQLSAHRAAQRAEAGTKSPAARGPTLTSGRSRSRFSAQPQAGSDGPQTLPDLMRALADRHYARLLRHVRRQLWHDISAGELPRGVIDARSVVDEAIAQALGAPERRPASLNVVLWFYALTRRELARRRRAWQEQQATMVSLDELVEAGDEGEADEADGYDAEQPLDIVERQLDPPVAERKDVTPDPATPSPAETVANRDLLGEFRRIVSAWPEELRALFELHFVEGFNTRDIGFVLGRPEPYVRALVANLQERLRDTVREQAGI